MNQKSLDKKKTSELFEGAGSSLHQAFIGAVERDKEPKKISACCNAEVVTANSGLVGETNYYICTKCHNDCDVITEPKELDWSWIKLDKPLEVIVSQGMDRPFLVYGFNLFKQRVNLEVNNLLTQQRTELLEEIPKKIKGKNKEFVEGYNNAIDDITNLINKKNEITR